MRHTRYILLMGLLVAAIATQRVVASAGFGVGGFRSVGLAPDLTMVARQLARRIARQENKPSQRWVMVRQLLARHRLVLRVQGLVSVLMPARVFEAFAFRLPPPVLG